MIRNNEKISGKGALYEFGLYRGFSFWYANQIAHSMKLTLDFYGFDSFEGLPLSTVDQHRNWFQGNYACSLETVENNLRTWGMPLKYVLHKSFYSRESFHTFDIKHNPQQCTIAVIDSDLYESAREVLRYLHKKIEIGSIILFDDYNAFNGDDQHGERKALIEFKNEYPNIIFDPIFSFGKYGQAFQIVSI